MHVLDQGPYAGGIIQMECGAFFFSHLQRQFMCQSVAQRGKGGEVNGQSRDIARQTFCEPFGFMLY